MRLELPTESALAQSAMGIARAWRDLAPTPLLVGLRGPLGSGKTTWVRNFLRGLGYEGRVPSPTYTLLEEYAVGAVTVVHVDLYRLGSDEEVEVIGLRDRLDVPGVWVFVEWPERARALERRCDLVLDLTEETPGARVVTLNARSPAGHRAVKACGQAR